MFIVTLILYGLFPFIYSDLTCLRCSNAPVADKCPYITRCAKGESCYSDEFVNSLGFIQFEMGCRDTKLCASARIKRNNSEYTDQDIYIPSMGKEVIGHVNITLRNTDTIGVCSQCCRGNLCNSGLCGQTGFSPHQLGQRGSICYACPQQTGTDTCNVIKQCGHNEECSTMAHNIILLGRRRNDVGVHNNNNCLMKCCNKDLCNLDCNNTTSQATVVNPCHSAPCKHGSCSSLLDTYNCVCESGYTGRNCSIQLEPLSDCKEILQAYGGPSGTYRVRMRSSGHVLSVRCDMDTSGGGWTVFQHRFNGHTDFYRTFNEYEHGFGDTDGEFWLGLKYVQEMISSSSTELRIDVTAADGTHGYGTWKDFTLATGPGYNLHVGQYYGSITDNNYWGLRGNERMKFSTYDKDQDTDHYNNCAQKYHGAWWYYGCTNINLNGDYATPGTYSSYAGSFGGVVYYNFKQWQSLKTTKMIFRQPASDCKEIQTNGGVSGTYQVKLRSSGHVVSVWCDMDTSGGGWTVFQHRFNGHTNFYRTFNEYEHGFGDTDGEFWLGLKYVQEMISSSSTELRIDVTAADGTSGYGTWKDFTLATGPGYNLHVGQYFGSIIDNNYWGLVGSQRMKFSTHDKDQDTDYNNNCAQKYHGAWWYFGCTNINLNGDYATPGTYSSYAGSFGGVVYYNFKQWQSLKTTKMMFRRV